MNVNFGHGQNVICKEKEKTKRVVGNALHFDEWLKMKVGRWVLIGYFPQLVHVS